jgi:hypothetical protein
VYAISGQFPYTISGQTITLQPAVSTEPIWAILHGLHHHSGAITLNLSPQGQSITGTVTGTFSLTTSFATVTGTITGTYSGF